MREIRIKQRRLYKIMKFTVIFSAIFLFLYIGAQPYVAKWSNIAAIICSYTCDFLVVAIMVVIFTYYSKYGKADGFLTTIEHELSDAGYYLTSRSERTSTEYVDVMADDLSQCGFAIDRNIEISEFDFEIRAYKKNEYFYVATVDELDKNDMLAYSDSAFNDITVQRLKRKGNGVICFVTEKAQMDAVAISKVITPFGKKEQLKVSYAIVELSTGRVYFLGNMTTKCQQMTANYVMNCDVPIKEQYIGKERLECQDSLEEKMKTFTLVEFKSGTFYAH